MIVKIYTSLITIALFTSKMLINRKQIFKHKYEFKQSET